MELTAVVVDYRTPTIEGLVAALIEAGVPQIIVVDNATPKAAHVQEASSSGEVLRIAAGKNLGYGAAVNWAAALCNSDSILLLNPDVSIGREAIERLAATLASSQGAAAVGPLTLTASGEPYPSFRRFPTLLDAGMHAVLGLLWPSNPGSRRYRLESAAPASAVEVPWISGACMMLSRRWFRRIGGFDPAYFLYLEDVDLCRRFHLAGGQVVFDPGAVITHYGQLSSGGARFRSLLHHHRSLLRYGLREYRSLPRWLMVMAGVAVRLAAVSAKALAAREREPFRGGGAEHDW